MLDYLVLYHSQTGNTKKIAAKIFESLPGTAKDLVSIEDYAGIPEAKIYFVGFCVQRGTCNMRIIDALGELSCKQVALFGTCGTGYDAGYYRKMEERMKVWVEDDCKYLGMFLCQGRMPMKIREKCVDIQGGGSAHHAAKMIQNFDQAMTHPDEQDLEQAGMFVKNILQNII